MRRLALTALVAASACSAHLSTLPEHVFAGQDYPCDVSRRLPMIDTALAVVAAGVFAAIVAEASTCEGTDCSSTTSIGFLYAPVAVGFGWSAAKGFVETGRCRAYREHRLVLEPMPPPRPAPDPALVGSACERIPGVAHGGRCPPGLVCRDDVCRP